MVFEETFITTGCAKKLKPNACMMLIAIATTDHLAYEEKPSFKDLISSIGIGERAGYSALKSLTTYGYTEKLRQRNESGQMGKYRYILTDLSKMFLRNFLGHKNEQKPLGDSCQKPLGGNSSVDTLTTSTFPQKNDPLGGKSSVVFGRKSEVVSLYNNITINNKYLIIIKKEVGGNVKVAEWITAFLGDPATFEYVGRLTKIFEEERLMKKMQELGLDFYFKRAIDQISNYENYEAFRKHFKNWVPTYLISDEYKNKSEIAQQPEGKTLSLAERIKAKKLVL